jgi:hypothetical protein
MPKRYIPSATQATLAVLVAGIQKLKPVKNRNIDINGKVVSNKFRLPKVSIVWLQVRI